MNTQPVTALTEWFRKHVLPDPKSKPPTYMQLARDTKDSIHAPLHARVSHYNSMPPRLMDVSAKEYNELLKEHADEDIGLVSKKTQLNSYPAYSADVTGKNIYAQPYANVCNTDTDNNILTRFQADPRFSNLTCAGTKYMSVDGEHVSPRKPTLNTYDALYDDSYSPLDALARPLQSLSSAAKASLDYLDTTRTPSFAQVTLGADITNGAQAALTIANKGHHLLHVRTQLQSATPSLDVALESDVFTNNCLVSVRGYGCDNSGADLAAIGVDVSAAGHTVSACVQSRPAFLPLINRDYRTRLAEVGGHVSVLGAGSGGGFGGGVVGAGVGAGSKLSAHRRSGRGSTNGIAPGTAGVALGAGAGGRLISVVPARGGLAINDCLLSGIDVLAAGLGSEREEHVYADLSAPLCLEHSPLTLNERERTLLDCPVVHLSLTRPVTPLFDTRNPYLHAFLGFRYSYSLYRSRWLAALEEEKEERARTATAVLGTTSDMATLLSSDPMQDPLHPLYLSPAAVRALRSVSLSYAQSCRHYTTTAELLDGGRHVRVMAAKHIFPRPPAPVAEEGVGERVLRFLGGEEKMPDTPTVMYPHFTTAVSVTTSLERLNLEHRAQYERAHYICARMHAEKRRAETAEYLHSVQSAGKAVGVATITRSNSNGHGTGSGGESPLALTFPSASSTPLSAGPRTLSPASSSPTASTASTSSSLQAPYIPLASLPPPPPRSLTDPTTYTSLLRTLVSSLDQVHHITLSATAHLSPQVAGAITLDTSGNVRLSARLRNGERESPFRRNTLTAPNAADDISRCAASFAALPAVDMPVSLEVAVQSSLRQPSLANTGVALRLQVGDV